MDTEALERQRAFGHVIYPTFGCRCDALVEGLDVLVRLRSGRCFYADLPPGPTGGRPRRHGAKFVRDDPITWLSPTSQWKATDTPYGWVHLQCWSDLHASRSATRSGERASRAPSSTGHVSAGGAPS